MSLIEEISRLTGFNEEKIKQVLGETNSDTFLQAWREYVSNRVSLSPHRVIRFAQCLELATTLVEIAQIFQEIFQSHLSFPEVLKKKARMKYREILLRQIKQAKSWRELGVIPKKLLLEKNYSKAFFGKCLSLAHTPEHTQQTHQLAWDSKADWLPSDFQVKLEKKHNQLLSELIDRTDDWREMRKFYEAFRLGVTAQEIEEKLMRKYVDLLSQATDTTEDKEGLLEIYSATPFKSRVETKAKKKLNRLYPGGLEG